METTPEVFIKQKFPRDAAAPNPLVLKYIGKRFLLSSEPPVGEEIDCAFKKRATGGGTLIGRDCRSNEVVEYLPQFAIWFACNNLLPLDENTFTPPRPTKMPGEGGGSISLSAKGKMS